MATTHHDDVRDVERGIGPELLGIVLAVVVLAAFVGLLVTVGA